MIINELSNIIKLNNYENKENIYLIQQYTNNDDNNKCIRYNLNNNNIDKLYLLNNEIFDIDILKNNKIIQKDIKGNLLYSDIFKLIDEEKLNGYIIVSPPNISFKDINNIFKTNIDNLITLDNEIWIIHTTNNINNKYLNIFNLEYNVINSYNKFKYLLKLLNYNIFNNNDYIKYIIEGDIIKNNSDKIINKPYYNIYNIIDINNEDKYLYNSLKNNEYNFNDNNILKTYIQNQLKYNNNIKILNLDKILSDFNNIIYILSNNDITDEIIKTFIKCLEILKFKYGILFDNNYNNIIEYSQEFFKSIYYSDIIAVNTEKYDNSIKFVDNLFIKDYELNKKININTFSLNIYNFINYKPWTIELKNKNILIISKYNKLIKERCKMTEKIYGIDLFPNCEFTFIDMIETNYDNKINKYNIIINNYKKLLEKSINLYDIALLDVDGYNSLFINILNMLDKSYIDLGNSLKYYFGLYDNDLLINNKEILYMYNNQYWQKI